MSAEKESIATTPAAVDARINVIDTAGFYGRGPTEPLTRRGLEGPRDRAPLRMTFVAMRAPDRSWGGVHTRAVAINNVPAYSLTRLGVDHIDIYRPARLDPAVPIEHPVAALAELVKAGFIRQISLSEVGVETIRRAQAVH